jgi:hypothetical protein
MLHMNDPAEVPPGAAIEACLTRTRSAVLNVLVGVGSMIALSGWILRRRAEDAIIPPSRRLHDGLMLALIAVAVASYVARRTWTRRPSASASGGEAARFYWAHVGSALIAALAAPLGLAYGWWVDPRLEGVIPFWVVALALGFLAVPRRGEFQAIDPLPPNPEANAT